MFQLSLHRKLDASMGIRTARHVIDESRRISKMLGTTSFAGSTMTLSKSLSSLRPPSDPALGMGKSSKTEIKDDDAESSTLRKSLSSIALRKIKKKPLGIVLQKQPEEPTVLPRVKSNNYNLHQEPDYSQFGKLNLNDNSNSIQEIKLKDHFHFLEKSVAQNIEGLVADSKFNVDLFNPQEMSTAEVLMILKRSHFNISPERIGNVQADYAALQEGQTWPGEYLFANSCRNIKLQRRKHKAYIQKYLEQLNHDLQTDLGLNHNEALAQTKH